MSKNLYFTDDHSHYHYLFGRPKLVGLNITEYWWLKEVMKNQSCKYSTSGFNEVFETIVTTPAGDSYNITEYSDIVMCVKKLQREA